MEKKFAISEQNVLKTKQSIIYAVLYNM